MKQKSLTFQVDDELYKSLLRAQSAYIAKFDKPMTIAELLRFLLRRALNDDPPIPEIK